MQNPIVILKQKLDLFWTDQQGAISIEWVILTAGVVVLAIGMYSVFGPGGDGKIGDEYAHLSFKFLEEGNNDIAYMMYALGLDTDFSEMSFMESTLIRLKARMLAFRACIGGTVGMGYDGDTPNQVQFQGACMFL